MGELPSCQTLVPFSWFSLFFIYIAAFSSIFSYMLAYGCGGQSVLCAVVKDKMNACRSDYKVFLDTAFQEKSFSGDSIVKEKQ